MGDWTRSVLICCNSSESFLWNKRKINCCLAASWFYKSLYVVDFMLILAVFLFCAKNGLFSLIMNGPTRSVHRRNFSASTSYAMHVWSKASACSSWAPGLRNVSVITFHCLGPFPYKNTVKTENSTNTQPFWPSGCQNLEVCSLDQKEGIPLSTNSPPFSPVQKMAERSKAKGSLGWERNQDGGRQQCFRCPNTVHHVFNRMAWKVWRTLAFYKRTFIPIGR